MAKSRGSQDALTGRSKAAAKSSSRIVAASKGAGASRAGSPQRARPTQKSPLEQAQKLVDKACRLRDPDRRIQLAEQALDLSQDCADAFTLLAEHAPDTRQALLLSALALEAAQRTMPAELLQTSVGHFWGIMETRPYMRARLAVAQRLWTAGRRADSIGHLRDLLRLNPNDNQGVRYLLAARLLEEGGGSELTELLGKYNEDSTFWSFTKALAAFQREGDTAEARLLLRKAGKRNKHVAKLLLSKMPSIGGQPEFYSPGDPFEADVYVEDFGGAWRNIPGAITWLRHADAASRARKRLLDVTTGPTQAVKQRLLRLPQRFGTEWQAAVSRLPTFVEDNRLPQRPWGFLAVDHLERRVVGQDMLVERPTMERVFDWLVESMERPITGEPHRPSEIQVIEEPVWEAIQPHLEEIGVDCIFRKELDGISFLQGQMRSMFLAEQDTTGLVESPKIELDQVAGFFAAADEYYRRAPWKRLPADTVIRVDCPSLRKRRTRPWHISAMGQSNLLPGLSLYDNIDALAEPWMAIGEIDLPVAMRGALAIFFGEEFELPLSDLLAAEEHRWPIAGPEAYPLVICPKKDFLPRQPEPWELRLLEGCLRALPQFAERHDLLDRPATDKFVVPTAGGPLEMTLSWSPADGGCGEDCHDCHEECSESSCEP